jgi:hypothetical protein
LVPQERRALPEIMLEELVEHLRYQLAHKQLQPFLPLVAPEAAVEVYHLAVLAASVLVGQ